jgi:transcriptional regulator with XRE-family HTH domain
MVGVQCRMARVGLGLTVRELAALVPCSNETVGRLELGETLKPRTIADVRRVLESLGVEFIDDPDAPGVKLRRPR